MEILVREEGAHLAHHILHEIFRLLFGDVQGHTVPHRPSELALVVSCQPVVAISDQIGVGLANGGGVSRSVELRDDADTSGVGVRDEVRDGLWRVGSFGMIGRLLLELYRRESEENEDMREGRPGYFEETNGKDSASTRCQWRVLSFNAAMESIVFSNKGTER
jgi:hypothetical protein